MDFKVWNNRKPELQAMCDEMSEIVLQAGGRFYFAKDGIIRSEHARRFLGEETIRKFCEIKQRVDPQGIVQTELYRRIFSR
jgi:decaprenylphospho-beta-D-ribofuranose 2-oxidase